MLCLRCGKDTKSESTFCASCLASMQAYPIKSDTPILLPDRNAYIAAQQQRVQVYAPTVEEQLRHQRKVNRILFIIIIVLSAALVFTSTLLVLKTGQFSEVHLPSNLGRNYTAVVTDG